MNDDRQVPQKFYHVIYSQVALIEQLTTYIQ